MLKRLISQADFDALPEAVRASYKKEGSEYVLQTEKDPRLDKLDEFRDNNRQLHTQVQELQASIKALKEQYGSIDPEEYKKGQDLLKQMKDEEEKTLIKAGKIDEVIARRTAAAISEHQAQVKELQKTLEKREQDYKRAVGQLEVLTIDHQVQAALDASGVKVRQGALPDILWRSRNSWKIDEATGQPYAVDKDGKKRFGADGNPLGMEEFVKKELLTSAGHLFESGGGGGAQGGKGGEPAGGKKVIDGTDPLAFGKNIDDIASGKVTVDVGGKP